MATTASPEVVGKGLSKKPTSDKKTKVSPFAKHKKVLIKNILIEKV